MAENENTGTEEPTPRRREESRKDGQVVQSPDLAAGLTLLTGCLVLMMQGPTMGLRLQDSIRIWFRDAPRAGWTQFHTSSGTRWMSSEIAGTCGTLLVCVMFVGLVISFLQVGFVISWRPMALDFGKLSPVKGWARIMSAESAVRATLSGMKVTFLLATSGVILYWRRDELSAGNFSSTSQLFLFGWNIGLTICISLTVVTLCLAVVDYISKWLQNENKLKMTRDEIRKEQKDESGDPTVKAAVRRRQRDAMKQRSVTDVPRATLILTNPTHLAVAIQYEPGRMPAPKVVAKGAGAFAKNIVMIAKKHHIPVLERKPIARALFKSVRVGQEIPTEFFRAIAEILTQIYRSRQSAMDQNKLHSSTN